MIAGSVTNDFEPLEKLTDRLLERDGSTGRESERGWPISCGRSGRYTYNNKKYLKNNSKRKIHYYNNPSKNIEIKEELCLRLRDRTRYSKSPIIFVDMLCKDGL